MTRRRAHILLVGACCTTLYLYGCRQETAPTAPVKKAEHTFSVKGSVREMNITPEITDFPEHEGKAEFMSYCAVCHSLRYISMQPDFPPKVWDAEVHKMIVKYNAPIDSATAKKITEYLVAIKSKP